MISSSAEANNDEDNSNLRSPVKYNPMANNYNTTLEKMQDSAAATINNDDEENALLSVLRQEQQVSMQQMEERLQLLIKNNNDDSKRVSYGVASAVTERRPDDNIDIDDQYYTMVEDIYSMMCVCPVNSISFIYVMIIFLVKLLFYSLILASIFTKAIIHPIEVEQFVKVTQLFMLPITVLATDNGVLASMFIFVHLKWSPGMEEQNDLITKQRYLYSNIARSVDAILYQVVIFFVLLQATEVLSVFLNFAALRFFLEIHTVGYEVARHGFLTVSLFKAAAKVGRIRIKATSCDTTERTAKIFFAASLGLMLAGWIFFSWIY